MYFWNISHISKKKKKKSLCCWVALHLVNNKEYRGIMEHSGFITMITMYEM